MSHRSYAAADEFLSNPYIKYEWLVYRLRKVFGQDSLAFQSQDFGFTLLLGVTQTGKDGKMKRCTVLVRRLICQHAFALPGEQGYGKECEIVGGKGHTVYDIAQKAEAIGRHKFIDETIDGMKLEFQKEDKECHELKVG